MIRGNEENLAKHNSVLTKLPNGEVARDYDPPSPPAKRAYEYAWVNWSYGDWSGNDPYVIYKDKGGHVYHVLFIRRRAGKKEVFDSRRKKAKGKQMGNDVRLKDRMLTICKTEVDNTGVTMTLSDGSSVSVSFCKIGPENNVHISFSTINVDVPIEIAHRFGNGLDVRYLPKES